MYFNLFLQISTGVWPAQLGVLRGLCSALAAAKACELLVQRLVVC